MDRARLAEALASGAPIRVINYHNTPAVRLEAYDRELAALGQRFSAVTEDDLAHFLETGDWRHERPGIIPALYNGYRNNYDVFRPLLEKHGLVGWFFAASGYVSCPVEDQLAFGAANTLKTIENEYPDGRYALSWDELRALDGPHVVASHTRNHTRVSLSDAVALEEEIVGSQRDFTRELGHKVRSFAWLFGGAFGENPLADGFVVEAGYQFLFSNLMVQRVTR